MITITTILLLLILMSLLIIPITVIGSKSMRVARLIQRLSCSFNCRRLYCLALLMILLLFHCTYISSIGKIVQPSDVYPSTVLTLSLFSNKFTENILSCLKDKHTFAMMAMMSLVCLASPHYFSLSVSMGFILLWSSIFPSTHNH